MEIVLWKRGQHVRSYWFLFTSQNNPQNKNKKHVSAFLNNVSNLGFMRKHAVIFSNLTESYFSIQILSQDLLWKDVCKIQTFLFY